MLPSMVERRRRRPEWKGPRVAVKVMLRPDAHRMLKTLVRRKHLPQGELIEALIRAEHAKG
jgi:hypothetical protein